jgi:hypothetical protein
MVEGVRASGGARPAPMARAGTKTAETGFFVDNGAAPLNQNARLSPSGAIGLEGLLVLQAVDEGSERDRSARKRGTALLASLTGLQRTLLAGEDPSLALRALSELTADDSTADDPGLAAIVRAIVQRSRIEIVRRELAESRRVDV